MGFFSNIPTDGIHKMCPPIGQLCTGAHDISPFIHAKVKRRVRSIFMSYPSSKPLIVCSLVPHTDAVAFIPLFHNGEHQTTGNRYFPAQVGKRAMVKCVLISFLAEILELLLA